MVIDQKIEVQDGKVVIHATSTKDGACLTTYDVEGHHHYCTASVKLTKAELAWLTATLNLLSK